MAARRMPGRLIGNRFFPIDICLWDSPAALRLGEHAPRARQAVSRHITTQCPVGELTQSGLTASPLQGPNRPILAENTTMHIMLAVCGRYAQGVVVRSRDVPEDLTKKLMILKRMILARYSPA